MSEELMRLIDILLNSATDATEGHTHHLFDSVDRDALIELHNELRTNKEELAQNETK